jgi:acyl-CoA thioesterase FadM
MTFTTRLLVRFHHADSAGIMFYGNLYFLAHHVFEDFVIAAGFAWKEWFDNPEWQVPVRRVETDYVKPKRAGRELDAELWLERLGETSITLRVRFRDDVGDLCSELMLVGVFTDRKTGTKIPIPRHARERLEKHVEPVPPLPKASA